MYLLSNSYDHIDLPHSNNSHCKKEKVRIRVNEHCYNSAQEILLVFQTSE